VKEAPSQKHVAGKDTSPPWWFVLLRKDGLNSAALSRQEASEAIVRTLEAPWNTPLLPDNYGITLNPRTDPWPIAEHNVRCFSTLSEGPGPEARSALERFLFWLRRRRRVVTAGILDGTWGLFGGVSHGSLATGLQVWGRQAATWQPGKCVHLRADATPLGAPLRAG
jgi:hypothetical protein